MTATTTETRTVRTTTVIGRILGATFLVALVATAGAGAFFWHQGYRLYAVRTGSMTPTFPAGTLVIDRPAGHTLPRVGKVITFRVNGALVTHRVHAVKSGGLTTKGDANDSPDAWTIGRNLVVGQVSTGIARGGYVLVFLQQPTGVPSLAVFALSVIFAWTLFFGSSAPSPASSATSGKSGSRRHRHRRLRPNGPTPAAFVAAALGVAAVGSIAGFASATQPTSAYFTSSRNISMSFTSACGDDAKHARRPHPACGEDDSAAGDNPSTDRLSGKTSTDAPSSGAATTDPSSAVPASTLPAAAEPTPVDTVPAAPVTAEPTQSAGATPAASEQSVG